MVTATDTFINKKIYEPSTIVEANKTGMKQSTTLPNLLSYDIDILTFI